jgi:murein tripeptide amidase MpaA
LCLCINITIGTYIRESKVRYDDYKVLRVQTPDVNAMKYISNPDHKSLYNIWKKPMIDGYSDIMIAPQNMAKVISGLNRARLEFSKMIDDVQKLIDIESKPVTKINADHPMTWTEYHPYEDMEKYMDYLEKTYPDLVSIEDIGKSYEGRSMKVRKICKGGKCGEKPAMWIDGGIHAREWISPAVATYHIRELVENREHRESDMLNKLDWYILPVHNPDGYEYSRTKDCPIEECRMWRKNRYFNFTSLHPTCSLIQLQTSVEYTL